MTVITLGTCDLCNDRQPVRAALVAWLEPIGSERFAHIDRCSDVAACRARVEAAGDPWPIREREEEVTR